MQRYELNSLEQAQREESAFAEWLEHPVTAKVWQYFRDLIAEQRRVWGEGEEWTENSKAHVNNAEEIVNMDFSQIVALYTDDDLYGSWDDAKEALKAMEQEEHDESEE